MAIDYGRYPMANGNLPNRNPETGVRYGIADPSDLAEWAIDEFESVYAQGCPHCGDVVEDRQDDDFTCAACGKDVDFDESWSEEPVEWIHKNEAEGLCLRLDDFGVWIYQSPVTTQGEHCSPCCPGAVSVYREPVAGGPTAYTLPKEWWR